MAAQWSDRHWPALAALAHELPDDQRPSNRDRYETWIHVTAPKQLRPTRYGDMGKWCIFRGERDVDETWQLVRAAVLIGKLLAAKVSGWQRAAQFHGRYVICVYVADSSNLDDVRRVRSVLRELGVTEQIGFKTDRATALRLSGDAEWLLRE
jgi:hypothetical protein